MQCRSEGCWFKSTVQYSVFYFYFFISNGKDIGSNPVNGKSVNSVYTNEKISHLSSLKSTIISQKINHLFSLKKSCAEIVPRSMPQHRKSSTQAKTNRHCWSIHIDPMWTGKKGFMTFFCFHKEIRINVCPGSRWLCRHNVNEVVDHADKVSA